MRRSFKFCISVILIMVLALSFTACSSAGFSEFGNMYNEIYQDSLDQMEEAYAEYAEALEEMDGLIPEMDPQEWSETSPKSTQDPTPTSIPTTEHTSPTETITPDELPADSSFSIHFIDVGQADAALVECDGHYMLIDGGNKADSDIIYTVLKKANVTHLDIVVGTHAHEDHIGGIPGAFNYASADLTLCPVTNYDSDAFDDFAKYANKNGGGITIPKVGDKYTLGSATINILGVNGGSDANDTSIVLKINYGETSYLFTGDAEREAEQAILNLGADLSATVLKVGHHGSDTSTTYPFLREIMPSYAIISVGEGNNYGHPTDDTLSRLRDADVEVFRTDLHGDIVITSDGKTVSFSTDHSVDSSAIMIPGDGYAEPEPTPEPTLDPTPELEPTESVEEYCWKSATGSKYHSINDCGRMNPDKAKRITVEQAERQGLEPCKKCWY